MYGCELPEHAAVRKKTRMDSRSNLVAPGELAPDFTASTHQGASVHLTDLRGKQNVVLVFYPGDDTPVCTKQLCELRDDWSALQSTDTIVFGVNPANETKHAQFVSKYHLPFPLLVDTGSRIAAAYGCSTLFGLLIRRTVYVIDKQGHVVFAQRGKPAVSAIRAALQATVAKEGT